MCKKPPEAITAMQLHSSEQSELLAIGHAMGRLIILSLPTSNGSRKVVFVTYDCTRNILYLFNMIS